MIIVSKNAVKGRNEMHMSYDEFKEKAFSEAGLDVNDTLMINIHDMEQDVYESAKGSDEIEFFSLTGTCPSWCDADKIHDWSDYGSGKPTSQRASAAGFNQSAMD